MQIKNTVSRYGALAKTFHWGMAIIIIGMLALGLYMTGLRISPEKLKLYRWHKEFGILVLMLVTLRILWRFIDSPPLLPFDMPAWHKFIAHGMHWALYIFMFAMPITGWLLTSAAGLPPSFFGLFVLPPLIAPNHDLMNLFAQVHQWLGFGLIAAICGHAAAALQHHFIEKDDILRRML